MESEIKIIYFKLPFIGVHFKQTQKKVANFAKDLQKSDEV